MEKTHGFQIKSTRTSVKFFIRDMMEEVIPVGAEKKV